MVIKSFLFYNEIEKMVNEAEDELEKRRRKLNRLILYLFLIFLILFILGMFGFRYLVGTNWIDAFYNSSLHFSGSGPVVPITSSAQKIFVSVYGMVSGFLFVGLAVFVIDQLVDLRFLE